MSGQPEDMAGEIAHRLDAAEHATAPTFKVHNSARLHELDGIRGWASLAVVAYHLFFETFGALFPAFRNPLTRTLDGSLAVSVFFVLSGEALSAPFFAGGGTRSIASLAVKRYTRLTIPILVLVLIALAVQRGGLVYAQAAAGIVDREDWLGRFVTQPIGIGEALRYALIRVYLNADSPSHLIPFLWTMSIEMLGSILVFALLGIWSTLRRNELLLLALLLLCETTYQTAPLACFVGGLLFGLWRTSGRFDRWQANPVQSAAALIVIAATLLLAYLTAGGYERVRAFLAMLLVGAIHAQPGATRLFRTGFSRLLGKLSFPLYLVQFPVIVSFTSWAIVRADAAGLLTQPVAIGICLASLAVALLAAVLFDPVEILTKRTGGWLSRTFVAPRG